MDLLEEIRKSYPAVLFEKIGDELKGCTDTMEMLNQDIFEFVDLYESKINDTVNPLSQRSQAMKRRLPTPVQGEEKVRRLREEIARYERRAAEQAEELHNSRLAAKLAFSLTGAVLTSNQGQYVGFVSCKKSGKYKILACNEDDPDLSDKLWHDVEQLLN